MTAGRRTQFLRCTEISADLYIQCTRIPGDGCIQMSGDRYTQLSLSLFGLTWGVTTHYNRAVIL